MLEIAYLSFKKSKIFLEGCPQTPLDGSPLRCSTRSSQNPSYRPDLLPYYVYLLVKTCIYIYMLVSPSPPRNMSPPPPQLHTLKRGPGFNNGRCVRTCFRDQTTYKARLDQHFCTERPMNNVYFVFPWSCHCHSKLGKRF